MLRIALVQEYVQSDSRCNYLIIFIRQQWRNEEFRMCSTKHVSLVGARSLIEELAENPTERPKQNIKYYSDDNNMHPLAF